MFDFEMVFGRFHPLIVHLPIGFLFLALLFKILDLRTGTLTYRPALKISLMLATVCAVVACITGLLLSWSSTYPHAPLDRHMWSGIFLTVATGTWYLMEFRWKWHPAYGYLTMGLVAVMVLVTGHRGGVLTHGETYLVEGLPPSWQQVLGHDALATQKLEFDIPHLDSARVYEDIVVPILEARCYSCHGDRKRKGELRLDSPEWIQKGGESNDPLITADLERSKLYHVLNLPLDDDLHMPPKGKTQLTEYEIEVLGSWIREGGQPGKRVAHFRDRVALDEWYDDLISDEKLFSNPLIPGGTVEPPDENWLTRLRDSGVLVQRVGLDNNYVEMSFINVRKLSPMLIQEATQLKNNVIWLDISGHSLNDGHLDHLIQFTKLTDLNMAHCTLPEQGLNKLSALADVQVLNLTGAQFGESGTEALREWPALRKVFTFQSGFSPESVASLAKDHPGIEVDTGGYRLPRVDRDTIVFRRQ